VSARPLGPLLAEAGVVPLTPVPPNLLVGGVRIDSRTVTPGDLFFALRGAVDDGVRHARHAAANGAVAVVAESPRLRPTPASPGCVSSRRASPWALSPASGSDDPTRR
jgi:UDP-N-acetylmuramyl pentapeptide synthase